MNQVRDIEGSNLIRLIQSLSADGFPLSHIKKVTGKSRSFIREIARQATEQDGSSEEIEFCPGCRKYVELPCRYCAATEAARQDQQLPDHFTDEQKNVLGLSVHVLLDQDPRLANTLCEEGIKTIYDLIRRRRSEISSIYGIGEKNIQLIYKAIEELRIREVLA